MSSNHRVRMEILVSVLVVAGTAATVLALVWYPTTLKPNIILSDPEYTMTSCVRYGTNGFANRYDWVFTLTNSGEADGMAWVRFALGPYALFNSYFVPRGSQVRASGLFYGDVHAEPSACAGPENVTVSLASFSRVPPVDNQHVTGTLVGAAGAVGFTALLLGAFEVALRRRGQSLLSLKGPASWGLAILVVFAAGFFSNVLVIAVQVIMAAQTPDNVPVSWSLAIPLSTAFTLIGLLVVYLAFRIARQNARSMPRPPPEAVNSRRPE